MGRRARAASWLAAGAALLWLLSAHESGSRVSLWLPESPEPLAHLLADFSLEPRLDPRVQWWSVAEDGGAAPAGWRYAVRYGGRALRGAGSVRAQALQVHTSHSRCRPAPSWLLPDVCEVEECAAEVSPAEGGSLYEERCSLRCVGWARLCGCGSGAARLRRERAERLERLLLDKKQLQ